MSGNRDKADERRERLAKELRANLKRRKAKTRAERGGDTAGSEPDPQAQQ